MLWFKTKYQEDSFVIKMNGKLNASPKSISYYI